MSQRAFNLHLQELRTVVPSFRINGVTYLSTLDVAERLGVKPGTLRAYIKRGVLPDVPMLRVGLKNQRGFTDSYVQAARKRLGQSDDVHKADKA